MKPEDFEELEIGEEDLIFVVYENKRATKPETRHRFVTGLFIDQGRTDRDGNRCFDVYPGYRYNPQRDELTLTQAGREQVSYGEIKSEKYVGLLKKRSEIVQLLKNSMRG